MTTTNGKRWRWTVLATALAMVPGVSAARGDGGGEAPPAGISVSGTGTVRARPTVVEITGGIAGEAELAADARVKFRDNKKKAVTTIENLKMPGLTVEAVGSEVVEAVDSSTRQQMMNGQGGGESGKTKVRITDKLRITLKDADKMDADKLMETVLKLVDASRDAGLELGSPMPTNNYWEMQQRAANGNPVVTFKIPDVTALQAEAYKRAVADAKAKAKNLAELTEVKLGPVRGVEDGGSGGSGGSGDSSSENVAAVVYSVISGGGLSAAAADDKGNVQGVASGTLADIPVTVKVKVQFDIAK